MQYKIPLGQSSFKELVSSKENLFVDKSLFIKEIIDSSEKAILITRPRGWGKSLNLDMLKTFFAPTLKNGEVDLAQAQQNRNLFDGLNIGSEKYIDTYEIAYRISLLRDDGTLRHDIDKYIDIVRHRNFPNKSYVLRKCTTNLEAFNQLEAEVKNYILTLKENFSGAEGLDGLISGYHEFIDASKKDHTKDIFQFRKEKYAKLDLIRDVIEKQMKILQESDHPKYLGLKQEFDLIGMYQGKYPVIYISLKDVTQTSVKEVTKSLEGLIKDLYKEHEYLKDSSALSEYDKTDFQKYLDQEYSGVELTFSLQFLSSLLHKHYDEKVYILIDEYDRPINSFLRTSLTGNSKEMKKVSQILTSMMSACGKGNEHLKRIILTGIFDAFKKDIGSGFNNIIIHGIEGIKFSKSFGFSEKEVSGLINKLNFKEEIANMVGTNIKEWYAGYNMPIAVGVNIRAASPWAVISYLKAAYEQNVYELKSYWPETGAANIIQALLTKEACIDSTLSQKLLSIVETGRIELDFSYSTSLFKYDLDNAQRDEDIFSYLLLNTGYLTVDKVNNGNLFSVPNFFFRIPNFEVKTEFIDLLKTRANDVSPNICNKLLDKLQEQQNTGAITFIKEGDAGALDELLLEETIPTPCTSVENDHHAAVVQGSSDVMTAGLVIGATITLLGLACMSRD